MPSSAAVETTSQMVWRIKKLGASRPMSESPQPVNSAATGRRSGSR